jgi:glycosyltransferase involved in cell wall biosynthesis
MLSLLAREHEVYFHSTGIEARPDADVRGRQLLVDAGVNILDGPVTRVLRDRQFDIILFEFHFVAKGIMDLARAWQHRARIVVDSVDLRFHRLRSRARLSGRADDQAIAEATYGSEIETYAKADLVIVVSEQEADLLRAEGITTSLEVIPTIHAMHPITPRISSDTLELVFVGSFKHEPNVDAMVYFCGEVLPLIRRRAPRMRLRIIGSEPTTQVRNLAAQDVEVLGYVPDTAPYLATSHISVAPVRFGAGLKGKVAEAIASGLPVVTTSCGSDGFGFTAGEHVLVADSTDGFADAVLSLWSDPDLYERIRTSGWNFIAERYSVDAVRSILHETVDRMNRLPCKRLPVTMRARIVGGHYLATHVLWRLQRTR